MEALNETVMRAAIAGAYNVHFTPKIIFINPIILFQSSNQPFMVEFYLFFLPAS